MSEANNILVLLEKDGKYSISTSFYRMMDFDAPMVGTNGGQIFQSEDGLFKDNLLMDGARFLSP